MKKRIVKETILLDDHGTPRCTSPEGTKAGAPLYIKKVVDAKSRGGKKR